MSDNKKVSEILKETHREIYGNNREIAQMFAGGNVGTTFLGLCIKEAGQLIAGSINNLADAIKSRPAPASPVTNNYYHSQSSKPDAAPKPPTKGKK